MLVKNLDHQFLCSCHTYTKESWSVSLVTAVVVDVVNVVAAGNGGGGGGGGDDADCYGNGVSLGSGNAGGKPDNETDIALELWPRWYHCCRCLCWSPQQVM